MLAPLCPQGTFHAASPRLLKLSQVVRLTNTSASTIRRAVDNGQLRAIRLPSGHRRFTEHDLKTWMGLVRPQVISEATEGKQGNHQPLRIAVCLRVSSNGQARAKGNSDKSSLQHQEDRINEYLRKNYPQAEVTYYRRTASGLDYENPVFCRMVTDILSGKFDLLVAQDPTRPIRFGHKLLAHLCKLGNCQIVYTMEQDDDTAKSATEELTSELLSLLTCFTARESARKAKLILQVNVPPEVISRIYTLHNQGWSVRSIAELLKKENLHKAEDGREITRAVVARILRSKQDIGKLLKAGGSLPTSPAFNHSFGRFARARLRMAPSEEGKGETSLSFKRLIEAYREWCEAENEMEIQSQRTISLTVQKMFPDCLRGYTGKGARVFRRLALLK